MPRRAPRQVSIVDGRARPTLQRLGVATVETDTKIYRKARVDLDMAERTAVVMSQQRTVLLSFADVDVVLVDESANPKVDWTQKFEIRGAGEPVLVTAVRTCNCGGTRVIDKKVARPA